MKSSIEENYQLPERLLALDSAVKLVLANAIDYEADINSRNLSLEQKKEHIQVAVSDLDRQAMPVFFEARVQVEGHYRYPYPSLVDGKVVISTIYEYGMRRGISLGFFGELAQRSSQADYDDEDSYQAMLSHGVRLGKMVVRTDLVELAGPATLKAPVAYSNLSLCVIEDYKSQTDAEKRVRSNQRDAEWTDELDSILYNADGPDLSKVGKILSRLKLLKGDKVYDYLGYINSTLRAESEVADVVCKYLMDYGPDNNAPLWVSTPELITGLNPTLGFGDAYAIDNARQAIVKQKFQIPILSMRATLPIHNSNQEHIIQIPLEAIQCSEFK